MFLGVRHGEGWGETDSLIATALEIFERVFVCSECGGLKAECHNDDYDGCFTIDDTVFCYAKAAMDRFYKEHQETQPGQIPTIRFEIPQRMKKEAT